MQEGIEKGMQKGIEQGMQKGIEQGIQEGIKNGKRRQQENVARKLLEMKMPIEKIIEITELSKEEIVKIQL